MIEDWSMDAVMAGLADGSIILVDVREPHEFALGHIPGSVSMPLSQFDPSALPDEAGRKLVFSCAAGVRSQHAMALARAAGLDHDRHFGGGFKQWLGAGGPVEQG
ncbi:MAG: rhodanese-like domain-containing protein [Beijerinckiaceae bacterium]|jgi:rhodanese-related sulfurtransferase|nr:rhodanese-like domain-containing protein [Beijerinckiaceae bacterium]